MSSAIPSQTDAPRHEPGLAAANERLLVRLGFDLHDGPLQQVYVLAQDVRLLREQVLALVGTGHRAPVVGRFADLESQLAELHRGPAGPGTLARAALAPAAAAAGRGRAGAREPWSAHRNEHVARRATGAFDSLSASQRIALLRVLQEALSNIRQHSGSLTVAVTLRDDDARVSAWRFGTTATASIPQASSPTRMAREASAWRACSERLRLLGGGLQLDSAPGGPTVVRAMLPHWSPPSATSV